jgi:hypothetical protein
LYCCCQVDGTALPLPETALVVVDFDIATWDFIMDEEDPTSSEGQVRLGFEVKGQGLGFNFGFGV